MPGMSFATYGDDRIRCIGAWMLDLTSSCFSECSTSAFNAPAATSGCLACSGRLSGWMTSTSFSEDEMCDESSDDIAVSMVVVEIKEQS